MALALAMVATGCSPSPSPSTTPPGPLVARQEAGGVGMAEGDRRLAEAIDAARASTLALEYGPRDSSGRRRMASGVVINEQGDVLSVRIDPPADQEKEKEKEKEADRDRDRAAIVARDVSGRRRPARWLAADADTGLTLLRVEPRGVRAIAPAAGEAWLGEEVFVVGNPYGLWHSVSWGHVAGLARHVEIGLPKPLGGLIQVQAPFHPGDSGAVLADRDGGWLGLVRVGLAPPGTSRSQPHPTGDDDFGFAIPARAALWVAEQLRGRGKVDRAYLGLKFAADDAGEGAEVDGVVDQSPAALAGLKRRDRVVKLDGHPIRNPDDLTDLLDLTLAGTRVDLEIIRGDARSRLAVPTASRPWTTPVEPAPRAPAAPPRSAVATIPREVLDKIERLERRVEELERREKPAAAATP